MSYDEWSDEFKPIMNHFNGLTYMFETYGEELDYVLSKSENNVWTYIDGDGGTYIVDGVSSVNRIGYYITEKSWDDNTVYEILVDRYDDYDYSVAVVNTNDSLKWNEVEVLKDPYFAGCDRIWARIDGQDDELTYEQVAKSRAVYSNEENTDGEQTLILSDGRRAQVQSINLQYNAKKVIGADVTYYWKEPDLLRTGLRSGYVSFGTYDESNDESNDGGCDSFGVHDSRIFHYMSDGVTELMAYMMKNDGEFVIADYSFVYDG
jgi:hypothetical protein